MSFQTDFDKCTYGSRVLECVNKYSDEFSTLIYGSPAKCKNHYCAIMDNQIQDSRNVMTCSGAIMKTSATNTLNALGGDNEIQLSEFGRIMKMTNFETFYFKDIRTTFDHDIVSISCNDLFKTCVKLSDDTEHCFGNIDDVFILSPWASFGLGLGIGIFCFGVLSAIVNYFVGKKWITFMVGMLSSLIPIISFPILWYISIWGFFGGLIISIVPLLVVWSFIGKGSAIPLSANVHKYQDF